MALKVRIDEVLTQELVDAKRDHIEDFLLQEGIIPHAVDISKTELSERQIKELVAELADDVPN